MSRVFLDTNILAYQFDGGSPEKQRAAHELLASDSHRFVVSTQVLLELFVVLTRKLQPALAPATARGVLERLTALPVVTADAELVVRAAATAERHQLSIWDAMIVEAAADAGCDAIWTEDLAGGSELRGVQIIDPLR